MSITVGQDVQTATEKVLCMEWIPLSQTALCLDCEACFRIAPQCPRCGSRTFALLSVFLNERTV